MRVWAAAIALLCALALTACGGSGGDTTTVIKEVQAPAEEAQAPVSSSSSASPSEPSGPPPNVLGLPLPTAKQLLKGAGYQAVAKNTDTAFGIVVESNYTICNQGKPRGNIVVVLAQKYGC